ncbi:hypothetical protein [Streptomyces monashensis]|nr:hypothetical protein [Streptomyces monashensis]
MFPLGNGGPASTADDWPAVCRMLLADGLSAGTTAAHVIPATSAITILLTQVAAMGPVPAPVIREFWRHAADA